METDLPRVRPGDETSGNAEFDRARALLADQREDEALDWFEVAIDAAAAPAVKASAAAHVAALLLGFGRPWEVAGFAATIRARGGSAALADVLEASACVQLGDPLGALQLLGDHGPVPVPSDPWYPCSAAGALATRVRALALSGRTDDAITEVRAGLEIDPNGHELWEAVASLATNGAIDPTGLVALVDREQLVEMFGWLGNSQAAGVDAIADALWQRHPGDVRVLAASALFAWRLDPERALMWTLRLVQAGVTNRAPVLERAELPLVAARDRVEAAIIGAAVDEPRARRALELAVPGVDDEHLADLLELAIDAETGLADSLVVASATTTQRCLRVAGRLIECGYGKEALAVLVAGLSRPEADDLTAEEFDRLLPEPQRLALASAADCVGDTEVVSILLSVPARG